MNTLLRGKREWEHWHQEQLEFIADHSVRITKLALKWAATVISFLLFLIYKGGSFLLWLIAAAFQGGRPMIEKSPGHFVEVSEEYSRLYSREAQNRYLRK